MARHEGNTRRLSKGQKRRARVLASRAAQKAKPKRTRERVA
jgi:hypothetical protein